MSVNMMVMLRRNFSSSAAKEACEPTEPSNWLTVVFFLSSMLFEDPNVRVPRTPARWPDAGRVSAPTMGTHFPPQFIAYWRYAPSFQRICTHLDTGFGEDARRR